MSYLLFYFLAVMHATLFVMFVVVLFGGDSYNFVFSLCFMAHCPYPSIIYSLTFFVHASLSSVVNHDICYHILKLGCSNFYQYFVAGSSGRCGGLCGCGYHHNTHSCLPLHVEVHKTIVVVITVKTILTLVCLCMWR